MNVLLVSGRFDAPGDRHAKDAELARSLAELGVDVRWIVPNGTTASAAIQGVRLESVESPAPGFAAVEGRLFDPLVEAAVSRTIRAELPEVLHLLDYGGATSVNVSWVGNRLGVKTVVSVERAMALCHRGDLVHAGGTACADWSDWKRCAECCLTPGPGALSRPATFLARCYAAIGWPLNPYPTPLAFQNREELLLGGLQFVERVRVRTEADAEGALALGVREEQLVRLAADAPAAAWLELYAGLVD